MDRHKQRGDAPILGALLEEMRADAAGRESPLRGPRPREMRSYAADLSLGVMASTLRGPHLKARFRKPQQPWATLPWTKLGRLLQDVKKDALEDAKREARTITSPPFLRARW